MNAAAVVSLVASIPTRLVMGWLLRRYGPRYCQVNCVNFRYRFGMFDPDTNKIDVA